MRTRTAGTIARGVLLSGALAGMLLGFTLPAGAAGRPHAVARGPRIQLPGRAFARSPIAGLLPIRLAGRPSDDTVSNELSLNGAETVTTSTGVTVNASIVAEEDQSSGSTQPASLDVYLTKQSSVDIEAHEWEFTLTRASMTFDKTTGAITIASGKQLNPFGTASLSFVPTFSGPEPCAVSGTTTFYQGTVTGKFMFNTRSKKWGSLGSSSFVFEEASAEYDNQCDQGTSPTTTPDCEASVSWDAVVSDTSSNMTIVQGASGTSPGGAPFVGMARAVDLSSPSGAVRIDVIEAPSPAPVLTVLSPGAKITVSTTPKDKVSAGSATGTSSASPTTTTNKCLDASDKKKTETDDDWAATVASDAGHTLTFRSAVGGNVKLMGAPGIAGDIYQDSYA
ncbi:MAG TPA: hypothetical protein VEM41_00455 [Actinomycetota bacterium]|nr:hypothetical protein [Actinomycetota bacterium]